MTRRKYDRIATSVLVIGLLQLSIGFAIVVGASAPISPTEEQARRRQSVDLDIDRLQSQQQVNNMRLQAIDDMKLPARMALLEQTAEDFKEMRRLQYGIIAGLFATLLAQVVQIRGNSRRRGEDEEK